MYFAEKTIAWRRAGFYYNLRHSHNREKKKCKVNKDMC